MNVKGYTSEAIRLLFNVDKDYKVGIRLCAVYQVSQGLSTREVSSFYRISFKQICNWVHRFEEAVIEGLKDKRKSGMRSRLSSEQKRRLKQLVLEERPDKFGYNTDTWNAPLLIDYIKKAYKINYKRTQIYNILKSVGLTFQKGRVQYMEGDAEKKKEFVKALKKNRESEKGTVILYEDEFSISNTATVSYGWSSRGNQPLVICKQKPRERQTTFGSIDITSGKLVVNFSERGNYQSFKKHLKKILWEFSSAPKIIMIVDNVKYHHAMLLKAFLKEHEKLELMYLPPYSPDLNLIERVWWYMRKTITHNRFMETLEEKKIKFWKMFSKFQKPNTELLTLCVINN